MRITRGSAPGTSISRAQSNGTSLRPSSRAATAGNSASRSEVQVKMQLTRSSWRSELRSSTARMSSSVAARMSSDAFRSTVVAPLSALSLMAAIVSGAALAPGLSQPLDLDRLQPPRLALLERAQPQRPERHPFERRHTVPDGLDHPAHLALLPFPDGDLHEAGPQRPYARRRGAPVL